MVVAVPLVALWLFGNLTRNFDRLGISSDFGFLSQPAGFVIPGSDFAATQPISDALLVAFANTLKAVIPGILLSLVLGLVVGLARLSSNWLVRRSAGVFVETMRNVPLLVLITFLYIAVLQQLPSIGDAHTPFGALVLSNRGLHMPWPGVADGAGGFMVVVGVAVLAAAAVAVWRTSVFNTTGTPHHRVLWSLGTFIVAVVPVWALTGRPVSIGLPELADRQITGGTSLTLEYSALLIALVLYTSAFIAEVVRGAIQAVPRGQSEAATALGLSAGLRMRFVVLPQALKIATPPTGNELLNLSKNSSLALAIAFPELMRITRQVISQGGPAPQSVLLMLAIFLALSLVIAVLVNLVNRRLQRMER